MSQHVESSLVVTFSLSNSIRVREEEEEAGGGHLIPKKHDVRMWHWRARATMNGIENGEGCKT